MTMAIPVIAWSRAGRAPRPPRPPRLRARRTAATTAAVLATTAVAWTATGAGALDAAPGDTFRVSRNAAGQPADTQSEMYTHRTISDDGRYVVFQSPAENLVAEGGVDPYYGVFVRDNVTGTIQLVSRDANGAKASGSDASISGDGRFVAFRTSSRLVPADHDLESDVYVRDLVAGTTTLVSVDNDGVNVAFHATGPVISRDGSAVVFVGDATNAGFPGVPHDQVMVRDLAAGTTTLVSRRADGTIGDGDAHLADISDDGSRIAFSSGAGNLADDGHDDGEMDVFVHDRATGSTELVSRRPDGAPIPGYSGYPAISGDGRSVAFVSNSADLGGPEGGSVFVRDLGARTTRAVVVGANGAPQHAGSPALSADGRHLVVTSRTALLEPDANGPDDDIVVIDLVTGKREWAAVSPTGEQADARSIHPAINASGTHIAFESWATNLTPDEPPAPVTEGGTVLWQVYLHERALPPGPGPGPGEHVDVVTPIAPARYWDTRGEPTFDGHASGTGVVGAEQVYRLAIAGRGDVPADATGVVANLAAVGPTGHGFATLFPCTAQRPIASHLNYVPGAIVANNAIVPLDATGHVCVFTKAASHFVLDVNGYVPHGSAFVGVQPARYLDTRQGATSFDGQVVGHGPVAAATFTEIQIAGRGDVPADATAAFVNVTALGTDPPGYVTLYPCGDRPVTSTVNLAADEIVPNGALVNLSDQGTLCAYVKVRTELIVDVTGYVPAGLDGLRALTPARLLDTRPGQPTVDHQSEGTGRLPAEGVVEVQVAGRGQVPDGATAAMFNVTVVGPDAAGYATLFPCGTRPTASNVNHATGGVVRANNAMTRLSPDGSVCIFTKSASDLVLDVTGWVG